MDFLESFLRDFSGIFNEFLRIFDEFLSIFKEFSGNSFGRFLGDFVGGRFGDFGIF